MFKNKISPCVVGLGYVGLPLFLKLDKFYRTTGYDIDKKRIFYLRRRIDHNQIDEKKFILRNNSSFTSDNKKIKKCNFFIITVPTPVNKRNKPDLKHIINASKHVGLILKKNDIVFYESTVYPGTTKEICIPILEKFSKLKYQKDFYVGYSPERINPGDPQKKIDNIKKIVAFENLLITKKVKSIYKKITKKIIYSNNIREAETSKVIENIQRDLNIGLMNEVYKVCKKMNINFNKVINLACTKWNFIRFSPGLVGGHCLPVDPYYFSYIAKKNNIDTKIILAGRKVNNSMKQFFISEIKKKIDLNDRILIFGLSYKKNVPDLRNSLAIEICEELKKKYNVNCFDNTIKDEKIIKKYKILKKIKDYKNFDKYIFLVIHDKFKAHYDFLKKNFKNKVIHLIDE